MKIVFPSIVISELFKGRRCMNNVEKTLVDWSAITVSVGALFQFLPAVASLLSVVWLSLRIYQTIKEIKNKD